MFLFAMLVSGSFSLGGLAAPHLDPAALNAIRFVLAACLMGALAALGPGLRRAHAAAPWRYLVLGSLLALYFVLMFVALRLTDPVSTGAVFTLTPALSAIFGWLLLRQVTTPRMAMALALAAAGAFWVIFRADIHAILAFRIGEGEAIFILGCAGHALYTPLVRKLNRGEPVIVFTFGVLVASAAMIVVAGGPSLVSTNYAALPGIVWVAILYLAIVTTAGTFWLLQFATMRLPSAKVMAYTYLVPTFILAWEWALGHGLPGWPILPGILATAAALLMLLRT